MESASQVKVDTALSGIHEKIISLQHKALELRRLRLSIAHADDELERIEQCLKLPKLTEKS